MKKIETRYGKFIFFVYMVIILILEVSEYIPFGWEQISSEKYFFISSTKDGSFWAADLIASQVDYYQYDAETNKYEYSHSLYWENVEEIQAICPVGEELWIAFMSGKIIKYHDEINSFKEEPIFENPTWVDCSVKGNDSLIIWDKENIVLKDVLENKNLIETQIDLDSEIHKVFQSSSGYLWVVPLNKKSIISLNNKTGDTVEHEFLQEFFPLRDIFFVKNLEEIWIRGKSQGGIYNNYKMKIIDNNILVPNFAFKDEEHSIDRIEFLPEKEAYIMIYSSGIYSYSNNILKKIPYSKKFYPSVIFGSVIINDDIIIVSHKGIFRWPMD